MPYRLSNLRAPLLALAMACSLSAQANIVTTNLDFENVLTPNGVGIYNPAPVGEFYNGGPSAASASQNGPDYDTVFLGGSLAARSIGQGSGTASFAPSASGPGAQVGVGALVLVGPSLTIDFLQPIIGEISLTYSSPLGSTVDLFGDMLDAQGNRVSVGSKSLVALSGYTSNVFDVWARETITLTGAATSLVIKGSAQALLIDNITFSRRIEDTSTGVPEPSSLALAALALGVAVVGRQRRKAG